MTRSYTGRGMRMDLYTRFGPCRFTIRTPGSFSNSVVTNCGEKPVILATSFTVYGMFSFITPRASPRQERARLDPEMCSGFGGCQPVIHSEDKAKANSDLLRLCEVLKLRALFGNRSRDFRTLLMTPRPALFASKTHPCETYARMRVCALTTTRAQITTRTCSLSCTQQ